MDRTNIKLSEEAAGSCYLRLFEAFTKFIKNDIHGYYSDDFDWSKVEEVHSSSSECMDQELDSENERSKSLEKEANNYVRKQKNKLFENTDFFNVDQEIRSIEYFDKIMRDLFPDIQFARESDLQGKTKSNNQKIIEGRIRDEASKILAQLKKDFPFIEALICDYYFRYNNRFYTLDMSFDFDSFGQNEDYYRDIYGDNFENMVYCEITEYHNYFDNNDRRTTMSFVYDKIKNEVVEITNISRYSLPNIEDPNVRTMMDEEQLAKILTL